MKKSILDMLRTKNVNPVISYLNLRRLIGILGILLPFVCLLGGKLFAGLPIKPSISDYYHTNVQDLFVGLLVSVSLFLMTYKGYEFIDNIVSKITGISALGIAIFPCLLAEGDKTPIGFFQVDPNFSYTLHIIFTVIFLLLLAGNSYFLFTLTDRTKKMSNNKKKRNNVYKVCGILIFILLIALIIIKLKVRPQIVEQYNIVFFLETIMLVSFGVSWLVKGETILRDPKPVKSVSVGGSPVLQL